MLTLVVIRASNLAHAERFWRALGLVMEREQHGQGPEHLACRLGSTVFEVYPRGVDEAATTSVRLGFAVAPLEQALAAAVAAGGTVISPPHDSPWGRRAVVSDPEGHRVELTLARGEPGE